MLALGVEAQGLRVEVPAPYDEDVLIIEMIAGTEVPLLSHRYLLPYSGAGETVSRQSTRRCQGAAGPSGTTATLAVRRDQDDRSASRRPLEPDGRAPPPWLF